MNDRPKAQAKAKARRRLSAALRENLKRRKEQARGRAAGAIVEHVGKEHVGKPYDSAGIVEEK